MPAAPSQSPSKYARQTRYRTQRSLKQSDIAPLPGVVDPERRARCKYDLRLFLETYYAEAFPLAWSEGHLQVIESVQRQIADGGSVAIAMPRGSGKTTLLRCAAVWALLYGHSPYVMIVAADAGKASNLLNIIKKSLRFNELLFEDFPEVCHPVRELQGQAINAGKQHIDGEFTLMDWKDNIAVLPTVEGSISSGARIDVMGVTSAGRGAQHALPDGRVIRPSLILIDDFQSRESAKSPTQVETRLRIIAGDLAGMKGPDNPLAMLAAVTVIYPDDAADQLLNRDKNPEWRGIRYRMVEKWPDNESLWEKYAELRMEAVRKDERPVAAEEFYVANREAMDAGAECSWEERKEGDISAIQHAYNLKLRIGDEAFNAEYQNDPDDFTDAAINYLSADQISAKINNLPQGQLAHAVQSVVAAIDVQSNHLWYGVAGFGDGFTGTLLDYGAWPDQGSRRFWTKRTIPRSFANDERYLSLTEEAAIVASIKDLLDHLAEQVWTDDTGAEHRISRVLVDEGYQTDNVHLAIQQSGHAQIAIPAKGVGIKATGLAMSEWKRRKGEPHPKNEHWRLRLSQGTKRSLRSMQWDAFYWRAFVHNRLLANQGDPGCLAWWGKSTVRHRMLAQHLDALLPFVNENGSRRIIEWKHRPDGRDDDLFDVMAMLHVAASEQGVVLMEKRAARPITPQSEGRMTVAEYMARRRRKGVA